MLKQQLGRAGGVLIDNQDIRQQDPLELRAAIGYVPQKPEFFYGTIAQNLRLGSPTASDGELREAAREAEVLADIEALPEGSSSTMYSHFAASVPSMSETALPAKTRFRICR